MTGAPRRALLLLGLALVAAAGLALSARRDSPPRPRPVAQRPTLLLLTSLPLVFSEAFALDGGGSKALTRLQSRYRVAPISVTNSADLAKGRLLLMAQPQAQTADNLVTLDDWVRSGGRLLLLADPMLEWPSKRPLGDPLRPAPMFTDTGLLAHWGLRLDTPVERGSVKRQLGDVEVTTLSPGTLHGACAIARDRLVAHCEVAKGRVTIVADADFLDTNKEADPKLDGLLEELAKLEAK